LTPDKSTVEATRKQVENELRQLGKGTNEYQQAQQREVKGIMAMVATLADSMASRETTYQVRFRGIAKKLRLLTTAENLATIRQHLADEVGELERYCEDMARDTQSALERLKSDISSRESTTEPRTLPASAQSEPIIDPVTLLHARREGEAAIEEILRTEGTYCILRFSISNGPALLQRFSKRVLDNLANAFAQRLRSYFGDALVMCRSDQWDFLAMQRGWLTEAVARAQELELRLSGSYHVPDDTGGEEHPSVDCHTVVVQPLRGEPLPDVLRRLHSAPVLTRT
jgi:hypothetical protein